MICILLMQYTYTYSCDCISIIGLNEAKSVFEGKVTGIQKIEMPYIRYVSRPEIGLHLGGIILVLVYTSFC